MLDKTEGGPAWAQGYNVRDLKSVCRMVKAHDEGMVHGAFGRYSERDLVGDLEAGQVVLGPLDAEGEPVWLISARALPRKQGIKDFTGGMRLRLEPGTG